MLRFYYSFQKIIVSRMNIQFSIDSMILYDFVIKIHY